MAIFKEGDEVEWKWGNGTASGTVREVHTGEDNKTTIETKNGNTVTRNSNDENPAYIIEQVDGTKVLKRESELCVN